MGASLLYSPPSRADGPTWYKKKQQAEQKKSEEEAEKRKQTGALIGGDASDDPGFSQLSVSDQKPPETDLLFKTKGLTDSLSFDAGNISQDQISGPIFSLQYALGWWWKPNLILSPYLRLSGLFNSAFIFMKVELGPQLRYFYKQNIPITVFAGFAVSRGANQADANSIPPPPSQTALDERHGIVAGAQVGYFFWTRNDLALGPTLSFRVGSQAERSFSEISLGFSLQSGRPYYGDEFAWEKKNN